MVERKKRKEAVVAKTKKKETVTPAKALEKIILSLKKHGAARGTVIRAGDVVVDERVRLKCLVPLCDSYNRNLMCPPRLPTVTFFRNVLKKFSRAVLIQVSADIDQPGDAFLHAKKLHELVNQGEKEAFEAGFRFAAGLIGGCCRLCEVCIAADPRTTGTPCRFPFRARPSMEAMGIDVIATIEKAGWTSAFPVTDRVTWTGMILV